MLRKAYRYYIKLAMLALILLGGLLVVTPTFAAGNVDNFYFESFEADYYLSRDENNVSHLKVIEKLTAVFPDYDQNHGLLRKIPITNNGGQNLVVENDRSFQVEVLRNDQPEPVQKIVAEDGYFAVYIQDPDVYVHGKQTYTLTYEFINVILDFDNQQELYWDTNGTGWSQSFQKLTARVHLAEDLQDVAINEPSCYVGIYGASGSNRCKITKTADGYEFSTSRLRPNENLTYDIAFEGSTFAMMPKRKSYALVISFIALVIATFLMIALMSVALSAIKKKRQYYKNYFIKPEYTPPAGFTVAEMATNYIGAKTGSDKVATLIELAVTHKVELIKVDTEDTKKTSWKVRIISTDISDEQIIVLKLLVGSKKSLEKGQEILIRTYHGHNSELVELDQRFTQYVTDKLEAKELSIKASLFRKPKNYADWLVIACMVWFIGWFTVLAVISETQLRSYIDLVGGDILFLIVVITFVAVAIALFMVFVKTKDFYSHTEKGLEYSRYLDGLKMYIKMAEADRLKLLQSVKGADTTHTGIVKLYERLLPYAIIFGLEKSWLEELNKYYAMEDVESPMWYVGIGAFSAQDFSSAIASIDSVASDSFTSSSSSSGSGGGGFSGGGGGGGGGGGL